MLVCVSHIASEAKGLTTRNMHSRPQGLGLRHTGENCSSYNMNIAVPETMSL